jgi:hypothetical protein
VSYDNWKLSSPYDDGPDVETVADFYGIEPEEVTDRMLSEYPHDLRERAATLFGED